MARKKRKTPGINGSSSADIAFMLLIFFLITTSMDTDMGLKRRLPPLAPKQQKQDVEINDRNLLRILVNRKDQISILKKGATGAQDQVIPVKLSDLKAVAAEFIANPNDRPDLPEKEVRFIKGLGDLNVTTSSYAISVKNEIETSYQQYISVQNEIIAAYNEVWNDFALKHFNTPYEKLSVSKQKIVLEAYPLHISEMPLANL